MSLHFSALGSRQTESDIARLMTTALANPDLLSLAAGFTDTETLPLAELTEMANLLGEEGDKSVLQYGTNQGHLGLRKLLTERLESQDCSATSYAIENSFISNGSQQALYLAVQTLCDAGDIILVEEPTYFVFLEMLRGLGVEAVSMPMLANGDVDVEGVSGLLDFYAERGELSRVKALYLVSYFANPSGHSVSRSCKESLLNLLNSYEGRIALFEDAAYRELYYDEPCEAESFLKLLGETSSVPVFYTTTLTKPFATGLKVGYGYCNHHEWLGKMLSLKGQQDFGTSNYDQALLFKALDTGLFDRHLAGLRKSYQSKMETLHDALETALIGMQWSWEKPAGGLYLWLTAPDGVRTGFDSEFHRMAVEQGVLYVPGELCHAKKTPLNRVRLSFGVLQPDALKKAAKRFADAVLSVSAPANL
ncbi:PLP-dependent aminotransferase family protein [Pelagicoccus albus]|uniref:PLP-dependent aminotransferase family protein n=1 Tax=Pelagicoccus albus TaxID=415222 RepID=A0A7X1B6X9_9BACT|nr:PLP-dependent aminotransferase family protein [Pelagicoccus albus]MBC2605505.1 PLP-dependent aminotransferase family protein [Pelagicoccus albus]